MKGKIFNAQEPKFKKGEMVVFVDCADDDLFLYCAEKVTKVIWRKGEWFYETDNSNISFRERHFVTREKAKELIESYLERHFKDINN